MQLQNGSFLLYEQCLACYESHRSEAVMFFCGSRQYFEYRHADMSVSLSSTHVMICWQTKYKSKGSES